MVSTLHTRWKLLVDLPTEAIISLPTIFNMSSGKSFVRALGGRSSLIFNPVTLSGTSKFYDLLRDILTKQGFEGRKFPLLHSGSGVTFNFQFRLYARKILAIEIIRSPIDYTKDVDLLATTAIWESPISHLVMSIIGFVRNPVKGFRPVGQRPTVFHCNCIISDSENYPTSEGLVELLTRHRSARPMVVEEVCEKNARLQSDASTLLVDRQGIVASIPSDVANDATVSKRFLAASHMLELVACVERAVERKFLVSGLDNLELADLTAYFRNPERRFAFSTSSRYIWKNLVAEFGLEPDRWAQIERDFGMLDIVNKSEVSILVVTAIEEEAVGILAALEDKKTEPVGGIYLMRGKYNVDDKRAAVYVFTVGVGNAKAALNTSKLLDVLRPDLTVFIGIAGGRKEAQIGSVVVANLVYNYESGKESQQGFFPRPRIANLSPKSESLLTAFLANVRGQDKAYEVYFKPIACGEKLVANTKGISASLVEDTYGDALALEMEGFGYLSALDGTNINAALVRGISDRLDKKGEEEDHATAIANATDLALRLISFYLSISHPQH
jgi:nucleoside phosphorylase